jgi:hypothetical protein
MLTTLSPPENTPADSSVPAVLLFVATAPLAKAKKQPFTVPPFVAIVNDTALEIAFDPADADDHDGVPRAFDAGVDQFG